MRPETIRDYINANEQKDYRSNRVHIRPHLWKSIRTAMRNSMHVIIWLLVLTLIIGMLMIRVRDLDAEQRLLRRQCIDDDTLVHVLRGYAISDDNQKSDSDRSAN